MDTANGSLGGSSFSLAGMKRVFDLEDEGDVVALLKLVHQNPIDAPIKNDLRDLIFGYKKDMPGAELLKLKEVFASFGITIETKNEETPVAQNTDEKATLGRVRPSPRFATAHTTEPQIVKKEEPVMVVQPEPIKVAEPVPTPAPVVEAVKEEVRTEVSPSSTNYSERIKEIKKIVNEKVGNPVNLIEQHGAIGREYMNALLDAMKKSSGVQGDTGKAMERLEAAFKTVEESIAKGGVKEEEKVEVKPEPAPVQVEKQIEESKPLEEKKEEEAIVTLAPEPVEVTPPKPEPIAEVQSTPQATSSLHSVAKEKQLQDLLRTERQKESLHHKEEEKVKIANMDPLETPEVTSGLNQLLSEWSLFRSSGLFGMGPGGKEHPLYKKIAPLTMAAVIAGRFEGATPQIKQSITDYMNGWRYEEGVVHEHAETFEHYLRKVIRHILERQKRK